MDRQRLEHALACEVLARQEVAQQLKELQQFVVAAAQLPAPEARAALAGKAHEIQQEWRLEKRATRLLEELEQQAAVEWVQERGLGPEDLQALPSCEQRGDHLFVEPGEATSPMKHGQDNSKLPLIIGHS